MITFKLINETEVEILNGGKNIGRIYSPSGSSRTNYNCIQICGFSEAFDFWGCAFYKGFKDIQLAFTGKPMEGAHDISFCKGSCIRCYMKPCACENPKENNLFENGKGNPFIIKREREVIAKQI